MLRQRAREVFWGRFKAELLAGGSVPGLAEAGPEISHHVACYNAARRHRRLALSCRAPNRFKIHPQTTSQLCPVWLDHLN
ncbi:hypothetical protein [Hymenobacter sp.]|uniref:hypothetical protein n=1 Tax=Hymenobacter sp. TaxID=1898978 RepID=UPI00286AB13F|nr:hypothetical protein [Hymenobacter sp.]